ncbi:hypothetical protein C474_13399 [Halogeometricum pallidum JCM 14848]|uniref:Glycine transporter domain-containing protein n=1 Tax=Halogeometricum pallidum JCM 14848 TaxID=1227487 RepID=M0D3G1_HALPD|nr:TRIC cation channel family protein [Halogeometricum pallidum]ELZ29388.1 hypothetical protein C474_13399 [Halogeometricum pallidum JCM 14848]
MTQELVEVLFVDPFDLMNTIGLVAFALVGATKAIREEFDLFGVTVVGLATAFAGGMTRDLLVNRIPLALSSPIEIGLGLFGVGLAVGISAALDSADTHPLTLFSDAVGLTAFTVTGAIVATQADISVFGVVAIATINAVGGGAIADVLLDRPPFILLDDFYASCAVLGGSTYWVVLTATGSNGTAAAVCAVTVIGTRFSALVHGWSIPKAQVLKSTGERHSRHD